MEDIDRCSSDAPPLRARFVRPATVSGKDMVQHKGHMRLRSQQHRKYYRTDFSASRAAIVITAIIAGESCSNTKHTGVVAQIDAQHSHQMPIMLLSHPSNIHMGTCYLRGMLKAPEGWQCEARSGRATV